MSLTNPRHFRVFVASPGDVKHERELALTVLGQLPYEPSFRGRITVEEVAWDKKGAGAPILANLTPQDSIKQGLPKPSECHIVVVIFWSRMGTPLPAEYLKKDGTQYHSGTEWEYEDAIQANELTGSPEVLLYRKTQKVLLDPDEEGFEEKTNQYKLVKAFFDSQINGDGSIRRGHNLYESPSDFKELLDFHLKSIIERLLQTPKSTASSNKIILPPAWPTSPFPGLRAFTFDDAPIFFGRERETDVLTQRVEQNKVVAIVGASGSGKSSLVGAGLIPRLLLTTGNKGWFPIRTTPDYLGSGDPYAALAASLLRDLPDLSNSELATSLARDPDFLGTICIANLATANGARILLFLDQFEELFTTVHERYRQSFIDMIVRTAGHERIHILITLRGDFYGRCVEVPQLAKLLEESTFPLSIPGIAALYQMITRPASRADLAFEEGLAQRILDDTGDEPGSLALMAYTLDELYRSSTENRKLTHHNYEGLGGVQGAIGKRSEAIFSNLSQRDQKALPDVFRELVDVDDRGTATRKRESLSRVTKSREANRLVKALTDARLLVQSRGENNQPFVEVAHEALFRSWERLAEWIKDTQDDLRLWRQVRIAAQEWDRNGRRDDFLWSQERLEPVFGMRERLNVDFDDILKEFATPEVERLFDELIANRKYFRQRPVIERFGEIGEASIPYLVRGLPHAIVKSSKKDIFETLRVHKPKAVPVLINACSSKDAQLRASAAEALSHIPHHSARRALVKLMQDKSRKVRRYAAIALGQLGGAASVSALEKGLEDTDGILQKICAIELAGFANVVILPIFLQVLQSQNAEIRAVSAGLLGILGNRVTEAPRYKYQYRSRDFIKMSDDYDLYDLLEQPIAKAEGKLQKEVVHLTLKALLKSIVDQDASVRQAVAKALGRIRHLDSIPALSSLLSDGVTEVREESVRALVNFTDKSIIPILISALKSSFPDVRSAAAIGLGELAYEADDYWTTANMQHAGKLRTQIFSSNASEVLPDLLNDADIKVRRSAAQALSRIGAPSTILPLVNILQDKDKDLRLYAATALGKIGDESVIPALIEALKDGDPQVVLATAKALGDLHDDRAIPSLLHLFRRDPQLGHWETRVKAAAVEALAKLMGGNAKEILQEALTSSEWEIRYASQKALNEMATSVPTEGHAREL